MDETSNDTTLERVQQSNKLQNPTDQKIVPIPSMGLEYLPTWMVDFWWVSRFHVGKYTSPMDGMGYKDHMIFFTTIC